HKVRGTPVVPARPLDAPLRSARPLGPGPPTFTTSPQLGAAEPGELTIRNGVHATSLHRSFLEQYAATPVIGSRRPARRPRATRGRDRRVLLRPGPSAECGSATAAATSWRRREAPWSPGRARPARSTRRSRLRPRVRAR